MKKILTPVLILLAAAFFQACKTDTLPESDDPQYSYDAAGTFTINDQDQTALGTMQFTRHLGNAGETFQLSGNSVLFNGYPGSVDQYHLYSKPVSFGLDLSISATTPDRSQFSHFFRTDSIPSFYNLPVAVSFSKATGDTLNIPGDPVNAGETVTVYTLSFGHFFPCGSQTAAGATTIIIPPNSMYVEAGASEIYFSRSRQTSTSAGNLSGRTSTYTWTHNSSHRPCTISN